MQSLVLGRDPATSTGESPARPSPLLSALDLPMYRGYMRWLACTPRWIRGTECTLCSSRVCGFELCLLELRLEMIQSQLGVSDLLVTTVGASPRRQSNIVTMAALMENYNGSGHGHTHDTSPTRAQHKHEEGQKMSSIIKSTYRGREHSPGDVEVMSLPFLTRGLLCVLIAERVETNTGSR